MITTATFEDADSKIRYKWKKQKVKKQEDKLNCTVFISFASCLDFLFVYTISGVYLY